MKSCHLFLSFFLILLSSCSGVNVSLQTDSDGFAVYQASYSIKNVPSSIKIRLSVDDSLRGAYKEAISEWCVMFYKNISASGSVFSNALAFTGTNQAYILFYQVGARMLRHIKNDLVLAAVLENTWNAWYRDNRSHPVMNNELYRSSEYLHNQDIGSWWQSLRTGEPPAGLLSRYAVKYLLDQVLYVSVMELMNRSYRYYNTQDVGTPFYQTVILPESMQFYEYMDKKFGRGMVMKFALTPFTDSNYKAVFGEELYESERLFTGAVTQGGFNNTPLEYETNRSTLDNILKLYNTATKPTLFQK